jgi:CheY-like chemotaxis protein
MGVIKRTIMVVDDSEVVLELTRSTLDAAGYHVLTRNRPSGSIAAMLQEEPDLVLVDVSMPGIGGDTLVRCFGTAHPTSKSIVLLYSSLPEEALAAKAAASGAHGYIQKSHDPARLLRQVKRWLEPVLSSGTFNKANRTPQEPVPAYRTDTSSPAISAVRAKGGGDAHYEDNVPRVLLADSDMLVLSQYRQHLGNEGFRFEFALSGSHALRVLTSPVPPELAVMGLDLGDLRGEDVYERAVAADPTWRERVTLVVNPEQEPRVPYFARSVIKTPVTPIALRLAVEQTWARSTSAVKTAAGT